MRHEVRQMANVAQVVAQKRSVCDTKCDKRAFSKKTRRSPVFQRTQIKTAMKFTAVLLFQL